MNRTAPHRRVAPRLLLLALAGLSMIVPSAYSQAPGPETFAKPPQTPMEYWDAADYLVRTGQARLAVPYINAFLQGSPDDATLLAIRDKYGVGSALRLQDDPATRPLAKQVLDLLNAAVLRNATEPSRIGRFVGNLSKSPEERAYAIERLREAGAVAVPALHPGAGRPLDHARESRDRGREHGQAQPLGSPPAGRGPRRHRSPARGRRGRGPGPDRRPACDGVPDLPRRLSQRPAQPR